ncbi:MAG TPA: hypothetical protein VNQ76_00045 [Planctomicrobium sp.]|nr:hypothetical protein [Planctomicrobium sp.]
MNDIVRAAFLGVILISFGCHTKTNMTELIPVTGAVMKSGKPVGNLNITFYPESIGAPSYATTDEEGKFELIYNDGRKGAVSGPHRVTINTSAPPSPSPEDSRVQVMISKVPSIEKTFEVNVSSQKNSFEFTFE